ncbi:MAG: hypothetical protein JSV36_14510, partial [Anaerolineae bacterium]
MTHYPGAKSESRTADRPGWLDAPLYSLVTLDWEMVLFVLILAAAVVVRFVGLSELSFSSDASVHAWGAHDLYTR